MANHAVILEPGTYRVQLNNPDGLTGGTPTSGYGLLYNYYAVEDARNISNVGWHVSLGFDDCQTTLTFLDPSAIGIYANTVGGKMKETGYTHWQSPNTGATNTTGFYGLGSGYRDDNGSFSSLNIEMEFWSSSAFDTGDYVSISSLIYNTESFRCPHSSYGTDTTTKKHGLSIRLVKDSTSLSDGESGTYVGNNGKVYNTICIGTREWLASNLAETKYRNGDSIPEVTDISTWSGLTSGALCAYNNNWSLVTEGNYLIYLSPSPL